MTMSYLRHGRFVALLLLAVSLPFELDQPLLQVGPLAVTNVELLLGLALGLTAIIALANPRQIRWPERYWFWLLPFCVGMMVAAAFAPLYVANAFKASLRLLSGLLLALAVIQVEPGRRVTPFLAGALLMGGFAAALPGLVEIIGNRELIWLSPFRAKITQAGPFLRLTGPFDYANQAAMFIEATLFLLLLFFSHESFGRLKTGFHESARNNQIRVNLWYSWLKPIGLSVALLLYLQAAFLTLSRASFATLLFVALFFAIVLTVWPHPALRRPAVGWLALAGVILVMTAVNSVGNSHFRLRLQAGSEAEWYRARLEMPERLTLAAGETTPVPVTVTNEGRFVWHSDGSTPIQLAGRWVDPTTQAEYGQVRWPFPDPVYPGETVQMDVGLSVPAKVGEIELYWDVVQEQVTWFGDKSGIREVTQVVVVAGENGAAAALPTRYLSEPVLPIPDRAVLWQVAWQFWRERPWLGIGLDNFRLRYGEKLSAAAWNDTVHTNNWYIEMVVSLGLLGSIPFFVWLSGLLREIIRIAINPDRNRYTLIIAAALLTFMIHGFLDFFLLFNATGLLFWLLVGLWARER